jgi:hypothetical protein
MMTPKPLRTMFSGVLLALVAGWAIAAPPEAKDPQIRVPAGPVVKTDADLKLSPDLLFVIDSDVPVLVLDSPRGLVRLSREAGPLRVRGRFVDRPEVIETRTFAGKHVTLVEPLATGRVELLILPTGATSEDLVIRRTLEIVGGDAPRPAPVPPTPPAPDPKPSPAPVEPGKRFILVIEETNDGGLERGKMFADRDLFARIKSQGHVWRAADKDTVDAKGQPPADLKPYLDRAKGQQLPRLFVIDPAGRVLVEEQLPSTPGAVLDLIKKAGG